MKAIDNKLLAELIILNREGKIEVKPGYDGVYGKAVINGREVGLESDGESKNSSLEKTSEKTSVIKKEKIVQKRLF
jgi:PHP family Zn ribbon phosphoesterase